MVVDGREVAALTPTMTMGRENGLEWRLFGISSNAGGAGSPFVGKTARKRRVRKLISAAGDAHPYSAPTSGLRTHPYTACITQQKETSMLASLAIQLGTNEPLSGELRQ